MATKKKKKSQKKISKSAKKIAKRVVKSKASKKLSSKKKLSKKRSSSSVRKKTTSKKSVRPVKKVSGSKKSAKAFKKTSSSKKLLVVRKSSSKKKKQTPKSSNREKRKILELKRELENLNKEIYEVVPIKDAEGRFYCYDESCDQPAVTDVYCRYHYLALWKFLQARKKLLADEYLKKTIEEFTNSLGEGALLFLLRDLKTERAFETVAKEMNLHSSKEEDTGIIELDPSVLL